MSHQDGSNEYPKHMFSIVNKKSMVVMSRQFWSRAIYLCYHYDINVLLHYDYAEYIQKAIR